MVWAPAARVELVIDQAPPVAVPVPRTVVPSVSNRVTVEPLSAVPVKVGVVALVRLSVLDAPASLVRSGADGAFGASVSKVSAGVVPAPPLLPAASV